MRRILLTAALAASGLGLAACDMPRAFGDANSIVVVSRPDLWEQVGDTMQAVLEPQIYTVRQERTFTLTHQDPEGEAWPRLQKFRQELLIGTEDDFWVAEALDRSDEPLSPPEIVQVQNVWARDQLVTILLLPPGGGAGEVLELLDPLHELFDEQYREYTVNRMFVSGRDTALAGRLERENGFRLVVPRVYRFRSEDDSTFVFRNDNPDPSELIREVSVSWRSPLPDETPTDSLLPWRERIAEAHYNYPQVHDTSRVQRSSPTVDGLEITEIQAVWSNPPDEAFPAAGPFILRAVRCPADDRLYLLDAWLYAPGEEKYPYMIQLETILDSFRCE